MKKTITGIILSIAATFLGIILNFNDLIFDSYDGPNVYNLVATIIFISIWVLFLLILIKTQHCKSIIYFCIFWIYTFIGWILLAALEVNSNVFNLIVSFLMIPAITPLYGIKYIMDNALYAYIVIAISFIMSAAGVLLLIHTKRSIKKSKIEN